MFKRGRAETVTNAEGRRSRWPHAGLLFSCALPGKLELVGRELKRSRATVLAASCRRQVLQAVAAGVQAQMGELLAAVMAPSSGLHAFDFLGGALLPEVDEAVSRSLPGELTCFQFVVQQDCKGSLL